MNKHIFFEMESAHRDTLRLTSYSFGEGEKSVCVVGNLRGNEVQQLYICSRLVSELKKLEEDGAINEAHSITVIPSVNNFSMNIGKRFWAADNTDINRMFPGYDKGEVTQRIAAALFEYVKGYTFGIQFASLYMPGDLVPHVRMMNTGYQNSSFANLFGLPYVVLRNPRPYDTTTLNYNWQLWNTNAFSLYTRATDTIDETQADEAVKSVLRFMGSLGIIRCKLHRGYIASVLQEDELEPVRADASGFYRRLKQPSDTVRAGEVIAQILDPFEGFVRSETRAPRDGVVFFSYNRPLVMEHEVLFRLI